MPQPLPNILLPLAQCLEETLAESVTAEMPVPHYATPPDGWAVAGEAGGGSHPQPAETDERLLLTLPEKRMLAVVELHRGSRQHEHRGAHPYGTVACWRPTAVTSCRRTPPLTCRTPSTDTGPWRATPWRTPPPPLPW
ncbi:hypothetical protein QJS66_10995 [Kocuria rhizophila]|nr:hypothetical protein QJS66_10995 [Kocuria rhizophila]